MTSRAPSVPRLRVGARALLLVAGLLGSTALFYLLRGGGLSLQAALVVTATSLRCRRWSGWRVATDRTGWRPSSPPC